MLIDTHCHINVIVKESFDTPLNDSELNAADHIIQAAMQAKVTTIINVATSLIESKNCILLAQRFPSVYATVGIHPNDLGTDWKKQLRQIQMLINNKEHNKIVGIGECGLDMHYEQYDLQQQIDAFRMQIELALAHNLALVVHTRDARDETLRVLQEYKGQIKRGIIHCFSEDLSFAQTVIEWDFAIGIGGTITYPKNEKLRIVGRDVPLSAIVLETDAPFLPPQSMRGKKNMPEYMVQTAHYLATLRQTSFEEVAAVTTKRAKEIFLL